MKKLAFATTFLFSLSTLAALLLPAGHSTCLNSTNPLVIPTCEEGSRFYVDGEGQCGCLPERDVTPAEVCARIRMVCPENEGLSYRTIYENRQMCGIYEKVEIGCGCFGTEDEGVHAWSEDVQ
jgi:hypothetical protein